MLPQPQPRWEIENESESHSLSWQRKLCVKMALKGICADNG